MPTYLQMNCSGSIGKFDKKEFSLNSIELVNYNIFIIVRHIFS